MILKCAQDNWIVYELLFQADELLALKFRWRVDQCSQEFLSECATTDDFYPINPSFCDIS